MAPRLLKSTATIAALLIVNSPSALAFSSSPNGVYQVKATSLAARNPEQNSENTSFSIRSNTPTRRSFFTTASSVIFTGALPSFAEDEDVSPPSTSFAEIAARAAQVKEELAEKEKAQAIKDEEIQQRRREYSQKLKDDKRTIYDFTLPVSGVEKNIADLVGQTFETQSTSNSGDEGAAVGDGIKLGSKVKAILVVNIKQDDPLARKNIPELIELANK